LFEIIMDKGDVLSPLDLVAFQFKQGKQRIKVLWFLN